MSSKIVQPYQFPVRGRKLLTGDGYPVWERPNVQPYQFPVRGRKPKVLPEICPLVPTAGVQPYQFPVRGRKLHLPKEGIYVKHLLGSNPTNSPSGDGNLMLPKLQKVCPIRLSGPTLPIPRQGTETSSGLNLNTQRVLNCPTLPIPRQGTETRSLLRAIVLATSCQQEVSNPTNSPSGGTETIDSNCFL
ncbi:conserved protein of unknown function [Limnospira indica PCC 8005]|uniref:Uncharacterized protein n=1 Tax=Limnospira indica PCC 8005 TaxID=376219 RepID=A0A9P1KI71_9CYAN|nr:conserved protein of unknown function [Limnospira indica PCC 8005]